MRKIQCLLAVITALSIFSANAQNSIFGGFKLSPNYSIFLDDAGNYKSGIGYNLGYYEVLELNNRINLQAEVGFSNYAFKNEEKVGTVTTKTTDNYRSVELPVMAKFRLSDEFAIGLGYQFSLAKGANSKTKTTTGSSSTTISNPDVAGINTSGFFLDANFKSEKTIFGLRVLNTKENFVTDVKSINASFYIGFSLF